MLKDEIASRLKQARMAAQFKRAAEAAESLGVPYQTYAAHENGNRMFDVEGAIQYARRFRVSLDWLLTGSGRGPGGQQSEAPITGDVGILSVLKRIDGLSDTDIDVAFAVIMNALNAKRAGSGQSDSHDQQQPANPHRVAEPSR
jgi:DNA-binding XRE family transcriptional regulator